MELCEPIVGEFLAIQLLDAIPLIRYMVIKLFIIEFLLLDSTINYLNLNISI
jgi:hypothetical protein